MCNQIDTLSTEDPTKPQLDATTAAVSGILCSGGSYECLEEIRSELNIRSLAQFTRVL